MVSLIRPFLAGGRSRLLTTFPPPVCYCLFLDIALVSSSFRCAPIVVESFPFKAQHHQGRMAPRNQTAPTKALAKEVSTTTSNTDNPSTQETTTSAAQTRKKSKKRLLLIRHGVSVANEYMNQDGNRWGDATFYDNINLRDAPLSETGMQQAKQLLQTLRDEYAHLFLNDTDTDDVLVVTSPLTRTLQTLEHGVRPLLLSSAAARHPSIVAQPLATERVYTSSDTGRDFQKLQEEFPHVTFPTQESSCWWYHNNNDAILEWRPSGQGQFYAVPGEPLHVFEERMQKFIEWLDEREERTIVLVTHWGILHHLTGEEFDNCQARLVEWDEKE